MSFIHPCFIRKNTPELRRYLTNLGYRSFCRIKYPNLRCNGGWVNNSPSCDGIDCGSNEELFKAIAALRDDSDYLQWFKYNNKWYLCEKDNWIEMLPLVSMGREFTDDEARYYWITFLGLFHKATVDELIEKFK